MPDANDLLMRAACACVRLGDGVGGITVAPKKGSALLWPSVLDGDLLARDDRTVRLSVVLHAY